MIKPKPRVIIVSGHTSDQEPLVSIPSPKKAQDTMKKTSEGPVSPSPLNFDAFVPWACAQWNVHDPVLVKITHEENPKTQKGKDGKVKSSRSFKAKSTVSTERENPILEVLVKTSSQKLEEALCVPMTAYYDGNTGHLVSISITNYRMKINKKIVQAISICAPFHPYMTKFTIRNCNITGPLLQAISALLFDSNITDICLDDTFLPQGNYHVLLDEITQLRYLSLSRCHINDLICTRIVQRLDVGHPASKSLQIIDFGSNFITDIGAKSIGQVLRNNRALLHINLAGNKITDAGLTSIVNALKEFPISRDEVMGMRKEKMCFVKNKIAVYHRCLKEVLNRASVSSTLSETSTNTSNVSKKLRLKRMSQTLNACEPEVLAEIMANRIVGEFRGAYSPQDIVMRNGYYYAKGNFTLCSINLAYNNLDYCSVKRICDMLAYQSEMVLPPYTGLMRVVLDGNDIPNYCAELDNIVMYLKQVITDNNPTVTCSPAKKFGSSLKLKTRSMQRVKYE